MVAVVVVVEEVVVVVVVVVAAEDAMLLSLFHTAMKTALRRPSSVGGAGARGRGYVYGDDDAMMPTPASKKCPTKTKPEVFFSSRGGLGEIIARAVVEVRHRG